MISGSVLKAAEVTIIGGGLAGSELALQLARRGRNVRLVEMRPDVPTPAHRSGDLAELVCSNSLKSDHPETASGLLKSELRLLGCLLLDIAADAAVPAGHALAVDRALFATKVTERIKSEPLIRIERYEQIDLDLPECSVISSGPLTSSALSEALEVHFGEDHLFFYDAISISISSDSLDSSRAFRASRYGKGGADYWNIALSSEEYTALIDFLLSAPKTEKRGFEDKRCFDACLPVEVIAGRGTESLRFGAMKPKGLIDPETGKQPHAALQLRQETLDGSMLGLVGFQTRLTRPAQRQLLGIIPGLEGAEIMRYGSIHRNTYIDSPRLLDERQMSRTRDGLFFSGQIVGVEGYMESIAHGLLTAINIDRYLDGKDPMQLPATTLLGALQRYLSSASVPFQPMNVNFGLLSTMQGSKRERKRLMAERSLESLQGALSE
jgi:methylenetetrahydrofolate--tRNA-(uracil-5-)-methyltransferase